MRSRGIDLDTYPTMAIFMLIAQTARSMCNETAMGVTLGHDELREFVERKIRLLMEPVSTTPAARPLPADSRPPVNNKRVGVPEQQ